MKKKRAIRNKFITAFTVEVTFPYKIEFLSEGRKETIFIDVKDDVFAERIDDEEKKYFTYKKTIKGFLNVTYFKPDISNELRSKGEKLKSKTDKRRLSDKEKDILFDYEVGEAKSFIWSVVFTNARNAEDNKLIALNEYEIITLSKLFPENRKEVILILNFQRLRQKMSASSV